MQELQKQQSNLIGQLLNVLAGLDQKRHLEEDKKRIEEELMKVTQAINVEMIKQSEIAKALKTKNESKKKKN